MIPRWGRDDGVITLLLDERPPTAAANAREVLLVQRGEGLEGSETIPDVGAGEAE